MNTLNLKGKIFTADQAVFEKSIMETMFNQRPVSNKPFMMVMPKEVEDIIQVVNFARKEGKKISICSGGHSWSANHVRNDNIVLDMSHFDQFEVNHEAMTAKAGPAVGGSTLLKYLMKKNLFFPSGHCEGVGLGGYLLQGGFGWNSRKIGMACESVMGIDLVTAQGEFVHASEKENPDLFWAARGSGSGFFGVVVAFHLKLHPKPKYIGAIGQLFSMKYAEDLYRWVHEVGPLVPDTIELQVLMSQACMQYLGPGMEVAFPIMADNRDEYEEARAFVKKVYFKASKARLNIPYVSFSIQTMYKIAMSHYPDHHAWGVDNMWTNASIDELMPHLLKIKETMIPRPTHMLWLNWYPPKSRPDMAFSMENNIYLALYAGWKPKNFKPEYNHWAADRMKEMEHLSNGIQLADENLNQRTAPFVSNENLIRLEKIRSERDPHGLFNTWHSKPEII